MLLSLITCFVLSLSFSIILAGTPLILGVWVLTIALSISILLGLITYSWLGFLIFLIYVGGILVIFAYFTAIQPNQYFNVIHITPLLITTFTLFIYLILSSHNTLISSLNSPTSVSILSLYHFINIPILALLGVILFLALVAVVKVSKSSLGPLRPFNYV